GADAILVTQPGHAYAGKTLRDIADELESDPIDAAISILVDSDPSIASFVMSRNDIETFAVQPWVMFASDGTDGHPRKDATYPKAYADFVLAGALIDLPEFVRKSTGLVADTFRLCRRGYIRVGYAADVVVIAPQQFAPVADYEN